MDLSKLTLSDKIIAGAGILLILDLLLFPWHSIDAGVFGSVKRTGVQSPNSFYGILALLLAVAVVAVVLIRIFSPDTKLPDLPVTLDRAIFFACVAIAALLLLKLVVETNFLGFGAYLGILLAAAMAYGGFLKFQADTGASRGSGTI